MQLHQITRPSTLKRPYRRVGRGQSSTRGKQSGRGGKGQTARAGHKIRPAMRDIIKKLPKRRGFGKNRGRTVNPRRLNAIPVSLALIAERFQDGAEINPGALREKGLIRRRGPIRPIKIVGSGAIGKKLSIKGIFASESARTAIEKAGGSLQQDKK